jgi:hypothetical protein
MGMLDGAASGAVAAGMGAAGIGAAGRLAVAGLVPGGSLNFKVGGIGVNLNLAGGLPDWRLRISLADSANYFYHAANPTDRGIMSPLFGSQTQNGVIFPYTPQVQVTHTANYAQQKFTHSNHPGYYYENSEVAAITISGDFTVQNIEEGQYLLAAITFFRAATKMWFGQGETGKGKQPGFPPPMVFLNGYGADYLPNVPCVITSFSHTMPQDVDYMDIPRVNPNATKGGIAGAVQQGVTGLMNGEGLSAVTSALQGGANSLLGSTMGPSGAGLNQLMGQLTGGAFGSPGASTRMPTHSQLSVTLQPVYSRTRTTMFSLDDFAAGNMVKSTKLGGFI